MRLIDADHLISRATTYYNPDGKTEDEMYPRGWGCTAQDDDDFVDFVNEEPTIDIVRCKECKHREKYPCNEITFYECSHLRLYGTKVGVEDDWFCADGERRASDT